MGSTMEEWLLLDGVPVCELILKVERLPADYPALAGRLGLDPAPLDVQNAHEHPPYMEVHTAATRRAVEEAEAWSIRRFGYVFGEDTKAEFLGEHSIPAK